jgi:biotin transport system substrate-specific component
MTSATLLVARTGFERHAAARDLVLVLGGSLFVALSAQVAFPLPGTPVPVSGQTLAVLLVGAALGAARGAITLALYLLEGALGLPFFAEGKAGVATLFLLPSAGYLWGFPIAAALVGALAQRGWDRRPGTTFLAMVAGNLVVYAAGLAWLARFVGSENALSMGMLPFLPGDVVKIALATLLLPAAWRTVRGQRWLRPNRRS